MLGAVAWLVFIAILRPLPMDTGWAWAILLLAALVYVPLALRLVNLELKSRIGWLLFHAPFGPVILATLAPTVFIIPYVVQRRQNTWTGVVVHAGLNGPGFVAVALGMV